MPLPFGRPDEMAVIGRCALLFSLVSRARRDVNSKTNSLLFK